MPSGSHGGRRGSSSRSRMSGSFSRSSSSSRSSSFGGSSRSYSGGHYHHHGPIRIRFGRRYYVYTGGSSAIGLLVVLFFFLLFGTFITSGIKNGAKSEIINLEEEYYYYQNMIDYAKTHPEYQKEATVTGRFYDSDMDKWYITYELDTQNTYAKLEGYTFAHYSSSQIYNIVVGSDIDVAVDSNPVNILTDSVDMAYDTVGLEDVGEYIAAKKSARTSTTVWVIFVILDILSVIGIVLYFYKKMKKEDEKEESKQETKVDPNTVICKYCKTVSDKGTKKCPSCGAGLKG